MTDYPILHRLMAAKIVWFDEDDREYVGLASDGVEVSLGNEKNQVERFLTNSPTPDKW